MKIEQIYTGCLAQGAYYIESEGEVAIIDPLREIKPYVEKAAQAGATIKYVLETHFHADFVSGHLDLARQTGADIVYGPLAQPNFKAHIATDGEELPLGSVKIRVLHTPGHTMESSCYLLIDETGKETALFSGDTLFIGDVGRPDLAQKADLTMNDLAGYLYESLRTKIMTLPDDVLVYPGHGAGSACGKNMSSETSDTLGNQKRFNYALRASMSKEEFIREVTDGLLAPPQYFPQNVALNKQGYESIDTVLERGAHALSPGAFEAAANETGALILDTRPAQIFRQGFIPNSINIGLGGQFAPWVGTLIPDVKHQLLLVCEPGQEQEALTRLARVGYDQVLGFLAGGFGPWQVSGKEIDTILSVSPESLASRMAENEGEIIDVRKPGEFAAEHIAGVRNIPLEYLNEHMAELPKNKTLFIHCAGGYRSMIAVSILRARGYENLVDVTGGFDAIRKSGLFEITDYVCPTALNKE
ncbi:MBL fold metallo-hydrolase [Larkinella rosea]|uniref:MBL fold metallo-hydrolase n=1 Tax=Larkinella rosea TaxID=2025312 RepID=A0A3P1BJP5_9BACT|nr:MBL fold metallo-hydrolase [Larkinella rosea]RRB01222.1 MBL fold metallo-hydrolase [Larkinella rosea]